MARATPSAAGRPKKPGDDGAWGAWDRLDVQSLSGRLQFLLGIREDPHKVIVHRLREVLDGLGQGKRLDHILHSWHRY